MKYVACAALLFAAPALAAETLALDGVWRFQLDRANAGIAGRWYERALAQSVRLPGNLPAQGIGDEVRVDTRWIGTIVDRAYFEDPEYDEYRRPGNIKVPFWLQPEKYYAGAAWYQRDVQIPESWKGLWIQLLLERPHWQTRVWLDGREIGSDDSLGTPHRYDLGFVPPGRHTLTIRVDNSLVIDIGANSHSISDHTQGNWNGIMGQLRLSAQPPVRIESAQVFPDVRTRSVWVRGSVRNATGQAAHGKVTATVEAGPGARPIRVPHSEIDIRAGGESTPFDAEIKLGTQAQLWDEFSPALYRLKLVFESGPIVDEHSLMFGLREVSTAGTQVTINGRRLFLRGTLECAVFPKTGHPPLDVESWKRILGVARAHGLNHFRFHSWCPPEAAFTAADELGFYYQVEASTWPNQSTTLGDGKPVDAWTDKETARILESYGNHPSFIMMAAGNEPGGRRANPWLSKWLERYKARDPRRLFTSGAGWPQLPENAYHVSPDPRIQHWGEGLKSRINSRPPETRTDYRAYIGERRVPVVSHEIGQWCVYPNFAEMPKYTGYLKPRNFEIFREKLERNHLGDRSADFLLASGKLQTICYKEDIESALRTPGMGGFQLLQLNDFPGQGTALVGVLDPFWESKGYVTPAEFSRFTNSTVPLARLDKRVFTTTETIVADIEVSHFGPAAVAASTSWKLVGDDGAVRAEGTIERRDIDSGGITPLGRVSVSLADVPAPARYKLAVGLQGTAFENDWDVWVYPENVDTAIPAGVTVVRELNEAAAAKLQAGGTVLLAIPPRRVKGGRKGPVQLGFSTVFWNTAWTKGQAPHTLGILCDPKHPALAAFPTDFHSNWQWWYLVANAGGMILDGLPQQLRPVVQVVDDWFQARRLGLVFEAGVGPGKLLVTSIDLERGKDPVSRQMLHSLLRYVSGADFKPAVQVSPDQIRALMNQ